MRVPLCIGFALAFAAETASTFAAEKPETPHPVFVHEYIRELAAIEDIRSSGERRLKQAAKDDTFSNLIYTGTRMQFELRAQIAALKDMRLNPPFEQLIATLTDFDTEKVDLYQKLIDISSAFIGSPKPGVDYDKLAAEVPKTRAALDYIDQSVFEATLLVFAMLIDQKADSKNHVSHLNITKAERTKLLSDITTSFGSKLDQNDTTYIVSSAFLLKANLLKDFKSSDEPWD